jgi:uncharacterized membrane protein YkvA (DUF1232 family)
MEGFKMNDINPEVIVNKHKNKAQEILEDKDKLQNLINEAAKKANNANGPIDKIIEDFKLLIGLITDFKSGNYRNVPYGSIIMIVVAIIYFVSPIDLIPDFIPVVGLSDDAAVIAFVIAQINSDLQAYKAWKGI